MKETMKLHTAQMLTALFSLGPFLSKQSSCLAVSIRMAHGTAESTAPMNFSPSFVLKSLESKWQATIVRCDRLGFWVAMMLVKFLRPNGVLSSKLSSSTVQPRFCMRFLMCCNDNNKILILLTSFSETGLYFGFTLGCWLLIFSCFIISKWIWMNQEGRILKTQNSWQLAKSMLSYILTSSRFQGSLHRGS